jgi:hypothetical protein
LFRHLRCLIYKTLFASITGANRLILVLCQSSHLEFSLLLFLIYCALRKGTWRSCTLRGFERLFLARETGARENYSETALNSSSSKLSGDWVFGYSEFCCSSAFAALVNELSEKHRKNCKLLNAVDRGQFALTH